MRRATATSFALLAGCLADNPGWDRAEETTTASSTTSAPTGTTSPGTSSSDASTTAETTGEGPPTLPEPLLYFAFEEDPVAVAGALDGSGNDLHGDCEACPVATQGVVGNAARFEGDSIRVPYDPRLDVSGSFTVAAWARDDGASPDAYSTVLGRPIGTGTDNSVELTVAPGDVRMFRFILGNGDGVHLNESASPFVDGQWHHVAGVFDGSSSMAYVDGTLVTLVPTVVPSFDMHGVYVGSDLNQEKAASHWVGAIDEVGIWPVALTAEQIALLADP